MTSYHQETREALVTAVNAAIAEQLASLQAKLEGVKNRHYLDKMTDNFYYTNGGYDAAVARINQLSAKIERLQKVTAELSDG